MTCSTSFLFSPMRVHLWIVVVFSVLLACQDNPLQTGVAGTGNAGRITGVVASNGSGIMAATRLLRFQDNGSATLVSTCSTDSSGAFGYESVQQGTYLVEAWQEGQLRGRSQKFFLRDSITNLVVILLQPQRIQLDLRSLGTIDSAYLDYPGNPVLPMDSLWNAQNLRGDSGTLYTKIRGDDGGSTWLRWKLNTSSGRLILSSLSGYTTPPSGMLDTGAFFVTKHTLALWTFDSLSPGNRIKDLSGHHNDLVFPSGKFLVPSTHGKALDLAQLPSDPVARLVGDSIPKSLRWWESDHQTLHFRLRVGENIPSTAVFFGTTSTFRIAINRHNQVQVENSFGDLEPSLYYCTYLSPQNVIPVKQWFSLTLYRNVAQNTFSLWIDDKPVALYSLNPTLAKLNGNPADSIVFTNYKWNRQPRIEVDEIEISDSIPSGEDLSTQVAHRQLVEVNSQELATFSFLEQNQGSTTFYADSSDTAWLGGFHDLYFRYKDFPKLLNRDISLAQLTLQVSGQSPLIYQKFTVHLIFQSFLDKIAKKEPPVAGVDFDSASASVAYVFKTGGIGYLNFDLTSIANNWSRNQDTLGFVIRSENHGAPQIRINLKPTSPSQPTLFSIWVN